MKVTLRRTLLMALIVLMVVGCMAVGIGAASAAEPTAESTVASIWGTNYGSLADAIAAADSGATITLTNDVGLTDTLTIPADKTITLNLNGKTISQTKAQTAGYQMILNDGNLTITDSLGGGKISYTDSGNGGEYISNTITNRGTLTLESGTIENLSSATVAQNGYPYAIDTSIWGTASEVNTIINGGTVTCANYSALRLLAGSTTKAVNVTINGGTVNGRIEVQNPSSNQATKGTLTVTGGTINKNNSSKAIMIFGAGGTAENLKVAISGGTFTGEIGYSTTFPINNFDENVITGGTFDTDVSAYLADGYELVKNENGTYGVYVATVNGVGYTDIQEAIKAAAPNGTVEILSDVTVDKWVMFAETLSIGNGNLITLNINGLTINGNGHTLTINSIESAGNGNHLFSNAKNLNIKDLTIKVVNGTGGIGLQSGTISNVTFDGGTYGVLPGTGEVTIEDCTFKTNGQSIYFEGDRNDLVVTGNTFDTAKDAYAINLRGDVTFTNNTITTGKVNVVNGSPVVTGNKFGTERFKVYNSATATITGNTINNLVFNDGTEAKSTFSNNTLSDDAKTALDAVTPDVAKIGETKYKSLQAAINAANGATVTLLADVTENITIADGATVVLDLNGKTLNGYIAPCEPTSLTVKNGSIKNTDSSKSAIEVNAGELIINNVNIESTRHAVRIDGAVKATINGGTYKLISSSGMTHYAVNVSGSANVTIKNGTFVGPAGTISDSGAAVLVRHTTSTVTIEGGSFSGGKNSTLGTKDGGNLTVKGGTFDQDPSAYVAEGYFVVNNNGTYTVALAVAKIGDTYYATLADALKAITDNCTVELLTDITISDNWDCRYNGAKITASGVTIDGKGHTLKLTGAVDDKNWNTVFRFEQFATVKNLTIDVSEATGVQRGISAKLSIDVINCTFIGNGTTAKYAIIYGEGAGTAISGVEVQIIASTFKNWSYGVSDNRNGQDARYVDISNCEFENANVLVSASETVYFDNNTMDGGYVNISSYTVPNKLAVRAMNTKVDSTKAADNKIVAKTINNAYYFQTPVAEVEGKLYITLAEAIKAADGKTITLLKDITLTEGVTVPAGANITLDLNGKTVSMSVAATKTSALITNNGTLTIKDSAENGKLTYVSSTLSTSYSTSTIINNGTLTVQSGIIENTSARGGAPYAIDSHNTLTVNGGVITATNTTAIRQVQSGSNDNTVTVTGGTISGGYAGLQVYVFSNAKETTTKITGGTFKGTYAFYTTFYNLTDSSNTKIEVSGGTFDGAVFLDNLNKGSTNLNVSITDGTFWGWTYVYTTDANGNEVPVKAISGGTFLTDVSDYLADGYKLVENNDSYGVVVDPAYGKVAQVGDTYYATLADAIEAAQSGETIVLLGNVTEGYDVSNMLIIPAGKNIILDLNGYTLTSYVMVAADRYKQLPQAVLTIQDFGENGTLFGAVCVEGTLNVTGGTITNNSSDIPMAISVAPDSYANYPVLNITGGTISYTGNSEQGFAIFASGTNGRVSDVTITGGTISSTAYSIGANANTKISGGTFTGVASLVGINEINGGTFNGDVTVQNMPVQTGANGAYVFDAVTSVTDGTFNGKVDFVNEASITGGTFKDEISYSDAYPTNPQKLTISGGTFANDVSAYVADDFVCKANTDGTYGIVNRPVPTSGGYGTIKYYEGGSYIHLNIDNAYAEESLVLKLYAGDVLLSTTELVDSTYFKWFGRLTANIELTRDSSEWKTTWEGFNPDAAVVPTTIEVYADGVLAYTTTVNVTADEWAATDGVKTYVAKIGDVKYETLADAIKAAQAGETITLLANVALDNTITINKSITIDGNGHKITTIEGFTGNKVALFELTNGATVTFKNLTFDGIKDVAVMRSVCADVIMDNCVIQNCAHTQIQGLLRLLGNATITNTKFLNNDCTMVITFCYDDTKWNEKLTIDDCEFSGNSCKGTAVIYFANGASAEITNTSFIDNTVTSTSNVATVYIGGAGNNYEVSGCTFKGNAVSTSTSWVTKIASAIYLNGGTVNKNVFDSNTATRAGTAISNVVYVITSAWNKDGKTDLGENYWGGNAPVPGKDYIVDSANSHAVAVADYYASYNATGLGYLTAISYVAKVGNYSYTTLADAIAAANAGDTITVIADIELTESVTVPAGKIITLDLNGKTISQSKAQTEGYQMILNDGNLTIKDSVGGGKISYTDSGNGGEYISNTITNRGTLTLESGTIENLSSATVAQNGYPYAIDTSIWGTASEVNTIINGGTVTCANYSALRLCANSTTKAVNVTINGGTVNGRIEVQNPTSNKATKGTLTVTGGTINKNNSSKAIMIFGAGGTAENLKVAISGGTFTGEIGTSTSFPISNFDWKIISGGTFNTDVSAYLVKGYKLVENNGTYGVVKMTLTLSGTGTEADPYQIASKSDLENLREMVNAGNNYKGKYFKLTADIDLAGGVAAASDEVVSNWTPIGTADAKFEGIFDGNGKTISNLIVNDRDASYLGLFGYVANATIKNVNIKNVTAFGKSYVAAVAGMAYTGTIDNCHVSGTIQIEGNYCVGGIAGAWYAKVTNSSVIGDDTETSYIRGVYAAANLEGDNVAGIIANGGESKTVTGCSVKNITIVGTRKVGAIIGSTTRTSVITDCSVENVVIGTNATADYATANSSSMTIGGLIGHYYGDSTGGNVTNCTVKDVTFTNKNSVSVNAGPIVGGNRTTPNAEVTGVTVTGNAIYSSTITGNTNTYLMVAVAQIGETKYYVLQDAINVGGEITLLADVTENITIADGATVVLDLNGKTLNGYIAPCKPASLTVENGSIKNTNSSKSAIEVNAGELTLTNVNIDSARHAVRIDGEVTATINGGTYKLIPSSGMTHYAVNVSGGATVTIENGTFVGPKGTISDSGAAVLVRDTSTVTINGGSFSGGKNNTLGTKDGGTLSVKGGTFDQDPSAYVAEGYRLVEGTTYRVVKALSGSGTVENPYLISSLEDLILFRNSVNEGETIYNASGVYVALNADIDMSSVDWSVNIGDDCNATFDGIFDGKGHTIKNLTSTETAQKSDGYVCTGLFGAIYGSAVIKNLTIENANITAGEYTGNNVGVVVGFVHSGTGSIENVKVTGTIKVNAPGVYGVGAIVGYAYESSLTIKDCKVEGNEDSAIVASSGAGAIIGYCGGKVTIKNCEVSGLSITGKGLVGGIAGTAHGTCKFDSCTVKNVNLTTTKDQWINSSAIVVGALAGDGLTVSGTTYENVTANGEAIDRIVGSTYIEKPTDVVPAVQARIGDTYYATIADAIAAAQTGDTITLLADITGTEQVTVNKTVTLDLNGKTIENTTASAYVLRVDDNSTLTLTDSSTEKNGTIKGEKGINVVQGSKLIMDGGNIEVTGATGAAIQVYGSEAVMNGGTITAEYGAILIYSNGTVRGTFTMNDGEMNTKNNSIFANGEEAWDDVDVTVNGGKITSEKTAIYWPATGKLTITGGELTGYTAIFIRSGSLEITGGTLTGTGAKVDYADLTSGQPLTGDALEIENIGGTTGYQPIKIITVTGGTFISKNAAAVASYTAGNEGADAVTGFISGGTFSGAVAEEYCTEGYIPTANTDGTYGVKEGTYVARNTTTGVGYETLQDAINAAQNGETVALLADNITLTEGVTVPAGKIITLDLNGKTISGTSSESTSYALITNKGDLTITGNGKITYQYTGASSNWSFTWGNYTIANRGKLTVEGGTIENTTNLTGHMYSAIDNYSGATTVINGGTVSCPNYVAIRLMAASTTVDNIVEINGGTISGKYTLWPQNASDNSAILNKATLTINGGTITATEGGVALFVSELCNTIVITKADAVELVAPAGYKWDDNGKLTAIIYVAQIGETKYESLQDAINAAQNGDTITLVRDVTEELVTIEKASGVAFTIDGKDFDFTGEFEIGIGESITIQNVNFVASSEISPEYFIDSMDRNSNCVLNILNCTFTDTDCSTTAIGTHQPTKVVIDGCTATGVASLLQNEGGYNITVKNTSIEGKRGISLGTVVGATVENVKITAADDKYGIRLNGENANNSITIKDCEIQAFIPVVVRKAQVENYVVTFEGTNTMTAKNTDDIWMAIGASEYEKNGEMPAAPVVKVQVVLNDTGLDKAGIYQKVIGLDGTGTEADPYLITSLEELIWFRDQVDSQASDGSTQFAGKYFKLMTDIDLAGINWNPIGSMSGNHGSFKGVFDGNGHTISNLNVQQAGNGLGLFAYTTGNAVIKNLTLNNVTVKSTDNSNYVGGLVGEAFASTKIENVHVTGNIDISGRGYIGGIVGHGYVVMDNVSVKGEGTIYSTFWCAGGILGYAGEGVTNITNATVEGTGETGLTITSAAGGLGAIVGMAEDNEGTQPISGSNLSAKNVAIKTYTGAYGDSYANYALGYLYGGNPTSKLTGTLTVENVEITTSNGEEPEVQDAVAIVDGTIYFNLQAAVNAGGEVKVLRNIPLADTLTISAGKTVTLDLNGKMVSMVYSTNVTANHTMISNNGNLTIKDSMGGGKLSYQYTGADTNFSKSTNTVTSNPGSTLTVKGGTIENLTTANGIAYAIDGLTNGGAGDVTVNIEGGVITSTKIAVRIFANSTTKTGTLKISGGEITGRVIVQNASASANKAKLTITGGTFSANDYKTDVLDVGGSNGATIDITASVSGGTFNGEIISTISASGFISGGKFNEAAKNGTNATLLAEGYDFGDLTDGYYVVAKWVAKVGNTKYQIIDEAIANWTNNTTLTLLADVTLSDVITLKSTEMHTLDLGTYTMTAASGKDAIQIENNGRTSAGYALDIKADATNPGGITATGKAVIRTTGKSGVKDRPIIRFYGGVFNASYIVYHSGSNGTNCPQFQFHGGEFNGTIYTNRALNQFYGGTFNGSLMMSVDSSAYTLISGGRFKQLSNLYMSALNSDKFTIGSAKGTYDRYVYIDDEDYYVVAEKLPDGVVIEADVSKTPGTNDYLKYSMVGTEGKLSYTDADAALKNNTSANVTIYVDELDLTGTSFKGTIIIEDTLTVTFAEGTTPAWEVNTVVEGKNVTYTETVANGVVTRTYKVFQPVAQVGETKYETLAEAINAAQNGETVTLIADNITLTEGVTVPAGKTITLDLNGNTVSMSVAATADSALITNNGTLTITGNGKLTYVSSTVSTSYSTSTIINNGTLTVESGTIENTSARGGAAYAIDSSNTLTVNGGTITSTYTTAIRQVQNGSNANTATVTGGTISGGYAGMQVHVMSNAKKTTTEIKGGTFEGTYAFYTTFYNLTDSSNTKIEVSGGTFNGYVMLYNGNNGSKNLNVSISGGTFGETYVYTKDADGNMVPVKSITGGTFANDVNEYCKDGYIADANADGTWTVRKANYVAEVNGTKYESLQAAIDAADGKTVTVLTAIELTEGVTVPAGKTITLDLNGKTVSMSVAATETSALITNNGTLTIKDSAGNGKLTYVSSTVSTSYSTSTIINNGTLTVESGTIENTSARGGAAYAIDSSNTLTVNGGTITSTYTTAIRQVQTGSNDNTVTVTGGTISGGYAGLQVYVFSNAKKTTTKIEDGTFKGTYAFYTTFSNATASSNTEIEVSGGTFNGYVMLYNGNNGSTNLNVSITNGTFNDETYVYTKDASGNVVPVKAISGGTFANDVNEYCADGYIAVKNENGTYGVKLGAYVAQVGETKYETLAEAIAAANANDTITLLADVTENVTVNKNLTIDGGNFKYTGKMDLTNVSVTIQKVNFVKGQINKDKDGTSEKVTVKNCTFDGQGLNGYAINLNTTNYIVIENCTAKNYVYGLLQVPSSNASVSVKNVEISDVGYGIKIDYSNGVTLENVNITASVAGVLNSNFGAKTITIKNSEINIYGTWTRDNTTKTTVVFEGENTVGEFVIDEAIDVFKLAAGATLTAPEGLNVTTTVADSKVVYENGTYKVVAKTYVAQIGETKYETLAEAINAAQNGETVTLIADIELTEGVTVPAGKTITLDLNGKTVSMSVAATETSALITNNGTLTIKDSAGNGKLTYVSSTVSTSYSTSTIINNGTLTVESGTIENTSARGGAPYAIDSHNTLTVNGGTITSTYTNAIRQVQSGSNDNTVTVTGGTISGGYAGMQVHVFSNAKKTNTVITGGDITGGSYAFFTYFYNVVDSSNTEIKVSGGTFDGDVYLYNGNKSSTNLNVSITNGTFNGETYVYTKDADGNEVPVKAISGGTFANDVNEYCAEDCHAHGENGVYTIHEIVKGEPVQENVVDATCTEGGSYDSVVYCECDRELSREEIAVDALGHKYESVVTPPTMDEQGYTTHTCTRCGDSYVDSYTESLYYALTVDGVKYKSWADAAAAIKTNSQIKLYDDVEFGIDENGKKVEHKFPSNCGNIEIDLNGYDLTFHHTVTVQYGTTLTVTDTSGTPGTLKTTASNYPFVINGKSLVNLENGVVFDGTVQFQNLHSGNKAYLQINGENIIGTDESLFVTEGSTVRMTLIDNYMILGLMSGHLTLTADLATLAGQNITIASGTSFTVAEGVTLTLDPATNVTVNGTINGDGTIAVGTKAHLDLVLSETEIKNIEILEGIAIDSYTLDRADVFYTGAANLIGTGVVITAGTFDADVVDNCAAGYAAKNNGDGTWTIVKGVILNVTTGKHYATLMEAVAAANDKDCIKLLEDVNIGSNIFAIQKTLTIDLNGKTIDGNSVVFRIDENGSLTVSNGIIKGINQSSGTILNNGGTLILNDSITVDSKKLEINNISIQNRSGTLIINGGTYLDKVQIGAGNATINAGTFIDVLEKTGNGTLTIYGGTFVQDVNEWCAEGYCAKNNGANENGITTWTVGKTVAGTPVIENVVKETCEAAGSYDTVVYCQHCGEELSRVTTTVAKLGHTYDEGVYTKPTFDADGFTTYTCSRCGDSYDDTDEGSKLVAVASVNGQRFESLAEAVEAAQAGDTVTLLGSFTGAGVVIDKSITIDFGGYTYTFNETVGSTGTTTLGFQILKNNTVVLKNGTLTSTATVEGSKEVKVLIQNYANLTLTNMNLVDNTEHILYALSNNSGNVVLNGATTITTDAVALDVYDYSSAGYALPVVTVADTVKITGKIEAAAKIGNIYYATFEAALDAAVADDTIVVYETVVLTEDGTLDLKGATVAAGANLSSTPVFRVLADVTVTNGTVDGTTGINSYAFIVGNSETAGELTIADGTYKGITSAISITNGVVNISGGTFATGYDNEGEDYGAQYLLNCIDAAYKNGTAVYNITGGTFVGFNPQNNAAEGANTNFLTATYAVTEANGDYTVVKAVASIGNVGYATFAEALTAAKAGDTIVLYKSVEITTDTTLDLTGLKINGNGVYPVIRVLNGANVTVKGGEITNTDYVFVLGASDGSTAGNLTIESGKFHGQTTVASVTKGTLTIKGGEFSADPYEGSYKYLINCIDANYRDDSANVVITGGTFKGFNPESNAAEGANTNFVAEGYCAEDNGNGTWTVVEESTTVYGDVNGDGSINVIDVVQLRQYIAGQTTNPIDVSAADVNGDGNINVVDVVELRKLIAANS